MHITKPLLVLLLTALPVLARDKLDIADYPGLGRLVVVQEHTISRASLVSLGPSDSSLRSSMQGSLRLYLGRPWVAQNGANVTTLGLFTVSVLENIAQPPSGCEAALIKPSTSLLDPTQYFASYFTVQCGADLTQLGVVGVAFLKGSPVAMLRILPLGQHPTGVEYDPSTDELTYSASGQSLRSELELATKYIEGVLR